MDQQQADNKENTDMLETTIRQFIDATRAYFFAPQPELTAEACPPSGACL